MWAWAQGTNPALTMSPGRHLRESCSARGRQFSFGWKVWEHHEGPHRETGVYNETWALKANMDSYCGSTLVILGLKDVFVGTAHISAPERFLV